MKATTTKQQLHQQQRFNMNKKEKLHNIIKNLKLNDGQKCVNKRIELLWVSNKGLSQGF